MSARGMGNARNRVKLIRTELTVMVMRIAAAQHNQLTAANATTPTIVPKCSSDAAEDRLVIADRQKEKSNPSCPGSRAQNPQPP